MRAKQQSPRPSLATVLEGPAARRADRRPAGHLLCVLLVPFAVSLVGAATRAQPPPDTVQTNLLFGRIFDRDGAVAAATITASHDGRERVATTDNQGRYRLLGLVPGRWEIAVTGDGYLSSTGFAVVAGRPTALDIELRRLDERTLASVVGQGRATVPGRLERANALLEEGKTSEARDEYAWALPHLDISRRAETLRAIARTHYLERQPERAAEVLWQAVELTPESDIGRQLYLEVMKTLGRERQAEQRLRDLDSRPAGPAVVRAPASPPPAESRPLPQPPEADRLGSFNVRFDRRHPSGLLAEVERRYGLSAEIFADAEAYSLDQESFAVHVPPGYHREQGWGILTWVSPSRRGGLHGEGLEALLARRRLIWVGAHRAGNSRPLWERIGLALDAAQEVQRYYDIDPERVFVGGYSGGGRIASALALLWPEVFRGGLFWFGVSWYDPVAVPYRPGQAWPAAFRRPQRRTLSLLQRERRFVLVTGDFDFNRSETAAIHRLMRAQGFGGVVYFQIPGADHYHGLDVEWLERALRHLEAAP